AARLAVAVLAGERAAVADDDVGRALDELAVALDAAAAHEVEVDAAMDEALAEVAVEGRLIVELVHQAPEVPEVVAHAVRRDRRVLPAGPGGFQSGHERGRAEPRLAQLPQLVRRGAAVVEQHGRGAAGAAQLIHEAQGVVTRVGQGVSAELDEAEPATGGEQLGDLAREALDAQIRNEA